MKKQFVLFIMFLLPMVVSAYDVVFDGIYYNLNSSTKCAYVTYKDYGDNSYSGAVTIPESITYSDVTYSVTCIGPYAFYGCTGLTSIEIPNSVTCIDDNAFYGCSGLTSIEIPNSVISIRGYAFYGCI